MKKLTKAEWELKLMQSKQFGPRGTWQRKLVVARYNKLVRSGKITGKILDVNA